MSQVNWKVLGLDHAIWPPIPYDGEEDRLSQKNLSPFDQQTTRKGKPLNWWQRHWMGTDQLGRDLFARLIRGTRTSLLVGIMAMAIATFIGVLLGGLAGYFASNRREISRMQWWGILLGSFLGGYYAFMFRRYALWDAVQGKAFLIGELAFSFILLLLCIWLGGFVGKKLSHFQWFGKKIQLPFDAVVMRVIEVMNSIPRLLLILAVAAAFKERSVWLVMGIIGLLGWTNIARYIRAEMLAVSQMEYVEAARALGFSEWRILMRHALPNAFPPILVLITLGIGGAILAESGLSFLSLVDRSSSWGGALAAARGGEFSHWWILFFPAMFIVLTVISLNLLGEHLRDIFDPRDQGGSEKTLPRL
ncbi:MAG: ABC transporter permease [Bacteroidota bacterium]